MHANPPERSRRAVFLNIPYDDRFRHLYIAYIAGLIHLDLDPHATIEIPGGKNRLDKIIDLIRGCRYSIHDLSRVELDRNPPFTTPRFNMPFELGLAVASAKLASAPHDWFVFETKHRRVSKSLSDLGGTDANIHNGTVEGVMRELCNSFERQPPGERPTVAEMVRTYRKVFALIPEILRKTRARGLFEASVFRLIYSVAQQAAASPRSR